MAQIVLSKKAAKYVKRMDARIKAQLIAKLEALAADPEHTPGIKPMEGEFEGHYRLRHGDLRVIYLWDEDSETIVVTAIGPRGDIYK
jgi:mRNA-degrading endonuclease RelE of RelBE toxin-antitoxin system